MKVINQDQNNWEDKLDSVLFCYRSSKNGSTKYSPFYLMYGREPKLPIEMRMEGNAPNGNQGQHDSKEISLDEKVQQLLKMKKSVHDLVVQNSDKAL